MMKALTGAAYFEALGQRDEMTERRGFLFKRPTWPQWAIDAYRRGHIKGSRIKW